MKKKLFFAAVILATFAIAAGAEDNIEQKKIEFLISSVENLTEAKFVRNGTEHDSRNAAKHLRLKIEKAGERVKTAEDFINLCASKSYITNQPYMIKYADGKMISARKYFREKLKEYNESKPK
jgi:hypothetical protein